jgi:hypothetical protein
VYRGNNPYLNQIAEGLRELGCEVIVKKVPTTSFEEGDSAVKIKDFIGTVSGKIVTDYTLYKIVQELHPGADIVNAYDLLETESGSKIESVDDILGMVGPVIDEIRANGREPLILVEPLGNHIGTFMSEEFREQQGEKERYSEFWDEWYASLIGKNFDVPVISKEEFHFIKGPPFTRPEGNVAQLLEARGISKEKAVVIVDHHIYKLQYDQVDRAGLSDIEIALICPCCIGLDVSALRALTEFGFTVYESKTSKAIKAPLTKLMG